MRHGLRTRLRATGGDPDRLSFDLFAAGAEVLPRNPPRVRAAFARVLAEQGVRVHVNARIDRVTPGALDTAGLTGRTELGAGDGTVSETGFPCVLHTAGGTLHALDEVLWVTAAAAPPWLAESGLATDQDGFVAIHPTLESTSHSGVFAAGDCAAVLAHPREKAGVFAVRQGPPLAENLRRALRGLPPRPFTPQRRYLSLIGTGGRHAVATRGGALVFEGDWVWRWKDLIDRRFMRKFADLPDMADDTKIDLPSGLAGDDAIRELSAVAMRCGGCGAKVGATVLARVMSRIEPVARDDVLIGLDAPDDAAVVETPPGKVMVHTVDSFRAMIDDPYLFGRIAANHSLGDVFAMGAEPQTALAIATLPYGLESKVEDTLAQMMTGATEVLSEAGAALVGGHTGEGAELALGFAVSGLVERGTILRKGGMSPGDRLILTKPLGTGALFAADMRHKARGAWITAALEVMQQSNHDGARCLHRRGASACTDVTGFGLLGHLVEMIRASEVDVGVDVELDLGAIPFLAGALDTVRRRRHHELAAAAEPAPAPRGTGSREGRGRPALAAALRPADRGRPARLRGRKRGRGMRRGAARAGLSAGRAHRARPGAERCLGAGDAGGLNATPTSRLRFRHKPAPAARRLLLAPLATRRLALLATATSAIPDASRRCGRSDAACKGSADGTPGRMTTGWRRTAWPARRSIPWR